MLYEMRLNREYFKQVEEGKKKIEVRLNDSKRKLLKVGDEILFSNRDKMSEKVKKEITMIQRFPSFDEMLKSTDLESLGFPCKMDKEEVLDVYYKFYTKEDEKNFGVVAIYLK